MFCLSLFPASAMAEEPVGTIHGSSEEEDERAVEGGGPCGGGEDEQADQGGVIDSLPIEDWADEPMSFSGDCGDNLIWTLDDDGVLTISGSGDMWDFGYGEAPWYDRRSGIHTALLSDLTRIGKNAFLGCTNLTSVSIPDSVTSIGENAFVQCSALTSVTIPSGVTRLGDWTFSRCEALASVTIPEGVTSIGNGVFARCISLTSVTIPAGVTVIGTEAFYGCSAMTSVTIPASVASIGAEAFTYCDALTEIWYGGTKAAWDALGVFYDYFSVSLHCSDGDFGPFGENYCGEDLTWTLDDDGVLTISGSGPMFDFENDKAPWHDRKSEIQTARLLSGVTSIGDYAFYNCSSLTSVTIPDSLTSIGNWAFCSDGLTSVEIPEGVTSIGDWAFFNCSSLTSVTIPASVTCIGDYSFRGCRGLTSVTIPEGVTSIGIGAFYGSSSLTSVTIPASVASVGKSVFEQCSGLTDIWYGSTQAAWRQLGVAHGHYGITVHCSDGDIGPFGTDHCGEDLIWTLDDSGVLTISGTGAMFDFDYGTVPWSDRLNEIQTVLPQSGVTSIGVNSFGWCYNLTSITIPEGVTSIGSGAFYGCCSLTSVTIPASVASIDFDAFASCNGLTEITFLGGAPYFGSSAFYDVTATAYYPANDPSWTEDVRQNYDGTITWVAYEPVQAPIITKQPADQTVAVGQTASFSVEASGDDLSYQWYYQKPGSEAWTAVSATAGKQATYTLTTAARHNGYRYKCVVSNSAGSAESSVALLTVYAKPVIRTQPADQTCKAGQMASFSVEATGGELSYQWYYQKPGSEAWNAVSAAAGKQATYTLSTAARHNGYRYKCVVTNSAGSAESSVALLTVYAKPVILTQPVDQTVTVGQTAGFSVEAEGLDLSYKWYYRTSAEASWKATSAASGKTANYSLTAEERHNGYQYRCKVTNPAGSVYTQAVTLTVNPAAKPVIVTQPQSVTGEIGKTAHFTVAAEGAGLSYQWYYRLPGTTAWKAVNAASGKTADYSLKPAERHNGYQYRCKVTNSAGTVTSKTVTLSVAGLAPVIVTQPKDVSVAAGGKAVFSVLAAGADLSYQWQYRTSPTGSWKAVSAASGKTAKYTLTAAERHDGYQYCCMIMNAQGGVITRYVTLTVTEAAPAGAPAPGQIS